MKPSVMTDSDNIVQITPWIVISDKEGSLGLHHEFYTHISKVQIPNAIIVITNYSRVEQFSNWHA